MERLAKLNALAQVRTSKVRSVLTDEEARAAILAYRRGVPTRDIQKALREPGARKSPNLYHVIGTWAMLNLFK